MFTVNKNAIGQSVISARELYAFLEVQTEFPKWCERMFEYGFIEGVDFNAVKIDEVRLEGSRQVKRGLIDYALTIDCAKGIAMLQRSEKGKEARAYFISLDNQVEAGLLLNAEQVIGLINLVPCFAIAEIRDDAKKQHFEAHNNRYDWHAYRADLLGYNANKLKEALAIIGEKYKSIDKAFMQLDKYLLIKYAVFDLLIAIGKGSEYSKNVSELAYKASKSMNLRFDRLDSTLFQIPLAIRENYLIAKSMV